MPARRRKRVVKKSSRNYTKPILVLAGFFILLAISIYFLTFNSISSSKFVVAATEKNGNAIVSVYDFRHNEITRVNIPSETYINAAYGFGEWRVGSLDRLGEQEGYDGELLRLSLVKTFHFPIDAWVDGNNSSLNWRQKLYLKWFDIKTPRQNMVEIDLADTGFLKKGLLPDREEGYLLQPTLPAEVGTIFSSPLDNAILRVGIYDSTERGNSSIQNLSELIHILGGDWAIVRKESNESDCFVRGENEEIAERIADILVCEIDQSPVEGNFDIEILVGNKFKERF